MHLCQISFRGKILKNNFFGPKCRSKYGPNLASKLGTKLGFLPFFFKFGSLVSLEIAYSDSLQQCITPTRGKTHKKNLGTKFVNV